MVAALIETTAFPALGAGLDPDKGDLLWAYASVCCHAYSDYKAGHMGPQVAAKVDSKLGCLWISEQSARVEAVGTAQVD